MVPLLVNFFGAPLLVLVHWRVLAARGSIVTAQFLGDVRKCRIHLLLKMFRELNLLDHKSPLAHHDTNKNKTVREVQRMIILLK